MRNPLLLTTGEVADIFGVAPRTAGQWIDSGLLSGYRLPSVTAGCADHRRVHHGDVMEFARRFPKRIQLLVATYRAPRLAYLADDCLFTTLSALHKVKSSVAVFDLSRHSRSDVLRFVGHCKVEFPTMLFGVILAEDGDVSRTENFDFVFRYGLDAIAFLEGESINAKSEFLAEGIYGHRRRNRPKKQG